jgi:FixJ family two-component response regulator
LQETVIAIVDDDALVLDAIGSLVRSFGYRTSLFPSATAFLAADRSGIACILSDFQMPDLTGVELARALNRQGARIPLLLMTAFSTSVTREQAVEEGIRVLLEKPIEGDALLAAIEQSLRGSA